ncbi:MAG: antitoxin VapB family protein [Candidatus Nanohaloarchaea archaeon]
MSTKNISLDEDAYNRLKNLKDEGESFSDVVKKVTNERSLKEIAGIISDEEADLMKEKISENREESLKRLDKVADSL